MSAESATLKAKKRSAPPPPITNPGHALPTTFFLKSERDMEQSIGAETMASQESNDEGRTPQASGLSDSSFGVRSLETTIADTFPHDNGLSRTNSNATESSMDADGDYSVPSGRKRKLRNPVHPKIRIAGQRILSHELASAQASSSGSPMSIRSSDYPWGGHLRRASTSSINLSQPLTPLRQSPRPESAVQSSPRSASMHSFKLSDEDGSVADETNSQAMQSSSGDDDETEHSIQPTQPSDGSLPQLVMPSIAMPARRPFTERGKRTGRFKIMVVGSSGVGKTSLLKSIFRVCEDIVHVDSLDHSTPSQSMRGSKSSTIESTKHITELTASTKPLPPWWYELEASRSWRKSSTGETPLDRNLCFVDTPGLDIPDTALSIEQYIETSLRRNASTEQMTESEQLHFMAGEGGVQVDVVLYLVDANESDVGTEMGSTHEHHAAFLHRLSERTNIIPIIGKADTVTTEQLQARQQQLQSLSNSLPAQDLRTFAISSALSEDLESMEASALMASGYVQPLVPSDLPQLVQRLLDPMNIQRLKYMSTRKFMTWRRDFLEAQVDLPKQTLLHSPLLAPATLPSLPAVTSSGSLEDEPSKVLVPYSDASYYRSSSPSASGKSGSAGLEASEYAITKRSESPSGTEPFRRIRLAKWAQDLHRSLENERKRFQKMYSNRPAEWDAEEAEKAETSLIRPEDAQQRPAKGRLGGDLGIIDPRDPLGVLAFGQAFRQRGWFMLQVAGGCGLLGAVMYWVHINWLELQEFLGFGHQHVINAPVFAAPEPARGPHYWVERAIGSARGLMNSVT